MTGPEPAVPELWWSPSRAADRAGVIIGGLLYRIEDGEYTTPLNLPADAVRLVPAVTPDVDPFNTVVEALVKADRPVTLSSTNVAVFAEALIQAGAFAALPMASEDRAAIEEIGRLLGLRPAPRVRLDAAAVLGRAFALPAPVPETQETDS